MQTQSILFSICISLRNLFPQLFENVFKKSEIFEKIFRKVNIEYFVFRLNLKYSLFNSFNYKLN